MLTPTERQKLAQVIVYFATHTEHCGKVKLFTLLYRLDFMHFRDTGRSVTRLDYRAWEMGPVPLELMQEWHQLQPDLAASIDILPEQVIDYVRDKVVPKVKFDASLFSKYQLQLLEELALTHRDDLTKPLVSFTQEERGPWDKIWNSGRGNNEPIPYALAIRESHPHTPATI